MSRKWLKSFRVRFTPSKPKERKPMTIGAQAKRTVDAILHAINTGRDCCEAAAKCLHEAVEEEREACAKIAQGPWSVACRTHTDLMGDIANAIRARDGFCWCWEQPKPGSAWRRPPVVEGNCLRCGKPVKPGRDEPGFHAVKLSSPVWPSTSDPSEAVLAQARAEAKGWEETARQYARDVDYYRGLVQRIGKLFGVAARTQDDGGVVEDVLCAKVPDLVKDLHRNWHALVGQLSQCVEGERHDDTRLVSSDPPDAIVSYLVKTIKGYRNTGIVSLREQYHKQRDQLMSLLDAAGCVRIDITMQEGVDAARTLLTSTRERIATAVAEEREACINTVETHRLPLSSTWSPNQVREHLATAIRARGKPAEPVPPVGPFGCGCWRPCGPDWIRDMRLANGIGQRDFADELYTHCPYCGNARRKA